MMEETNFAFTIHAVIQFFNNIRKSSLTSQLSSLNTNIRLRNIWKYLEENFLASMIAPQWLIKMAKRNRYSLNYTENGMKENQSVCY